MRRSPFRVAPLAVLVAVVFLQACAGVPPDLSSFAADRPAEPPLFGTLPSEKYLAKGKKHYRQGDYGLAEEAFRRAVEEDRNNAEAWLGLAASYDRLKRFDHAERAYEVVVRLIGNTPTVLNNLGFHYFLQGNRESARQTFLAASKADPNNPYIQNNLDLLWTPTDEIPEPRQGGRS
jgi:Flp pilus assembly protein TadD